MPEKEAKAKGTFLGTLIGAVVVSLISSGALSSAVNWGTSEKAAAEAKEAVAGEAKAEAAKVEKAIAEYIQKEVEPKITEAFESVDDDIELLDKELLTCRSELRETTVLAETALRLAERSMGRRAVERTMEGVDRAEPKPDRAPRAKKAPPKFNPYEQRAQVPGTPRALEGDPLATGD